MTGLTAHLARTLADDRVRGAEQARRARRAIQERPTSENRRLVVAAASGNEPVAEQRLVAAERSTALAERVAQLPPHQRRLLVALLAEPAPSYREIATSLHMPVGSIGPTRARLLKRLRKDGVLARTLQQDGHRSSKAR